MSDLEALHPDAIAAEVFPKVLELGHVAMQFAQVERATGDLAGNHESDTDHTVMLGFIAMALAEYDSRLDKGKVAQYALVHDLVEVYAGDTPTLHPDKVDFAAKARREAEALDTLRVQFGSVFPGFVQLIDDYEHMADLESTFVKTLDKCLPAISHLFNGGSHIDDKFSSVEELHQNAHHHHEKIASTYGADHPVAVALHRLISAQLIEEFAARRETEGLTA